MQHKKDVLIFLGDYIDKNSNSYKVIHCLINLKKEYGNQIITLKICSQLQAMTYFNANPIKCFRLPLVK